MRQGRQNQPGWTSTTFRRAYDEALPALQRVYKQATPEEQARIMELNLQAIGGRRACHTEAPGARDRFVAWAQSVGVILAVPPPRSPVPHTTVQLEAPPDGPLYVGVQKWDEIAYEGWVGTRTDRMMQGDEDPEYRTAWRDYVYDSYRQLTIDQRRRLHTLLRFFDPRLPAVRGLIRRDLLAESTTLMWVTRRLATARRFATTQYHAVLEVDPRRVAYYWWFPDEWQEEDSYVFVMPAVAEPDYRHGTRPTAPPSAFRLVR